MTDPMQAAGQPSPEEMRAYLEQLREADPAGLLAEAFNLLATGAQVKLGRPDARTLIDGLAGLVTAAQAALPAELLAQMQQGIAQLQTAQVQAEREAAAAGAAEPPAGDGAAGDTGEGAAAAGGPAGSPRMSEPPGQTAAQQRMTDRLWVPGRDPRPPAR